MTLNLCRYSVAEINSPFVPKAHASGYKYTASLKLKYWNSNNDCISNKLIKRVILEKPQSGEMFLAQSVSFGNSIKKYSAPAERYKWRK